MRAGRIYESAAERGVRRGRAFYAEFLCVEYLGVVGGVRRGRAFYAPNAVSGGEFFRGTAGTREFIIKKLK